ncbi:hypothetical protein K7432_011458 [Basidiobolus ranarum]|uniref:Uncharacterized protein n=1 Tax=Basidiobolus ranarum TaxID=34480 RepID=A0ABR2WMD5_9FUNG
MQFAIKVLAGIAAASVAFASASPSEKSTEIRKPARPGRNTTIPAMPEWMKEEGEGFGVTMDVAQAFAEALVGLFNSRQPKSVSPHTIEAEIWSSVWNGGNMYLGVQTRDMEEGDPYLGSIFPGKCSASCNGPSGQTSYNVPLMNANAAATTYIDLEGVSGSNTIAQVQSVQLAANTPAYTFLEAYCFDMGPTTIVGFSSGMHNICLNADIMMTCASITNRWIYTGVDKPVITMFSQGSTIAAHNLYINNVPNMIEWEDDLFNGKDITGALWNYCWTIDVDLGSYDGDGEFQGSSEKCNWNAAANSQSCRITNGQWIAPSTCGKCNGGFAEEDASLNGTEYIKTNSNNPVPKMREEDREKLQQAVGKFKLFREKYEQQPMQN